VLRLLLLKDEEIFRTTFVCVKQEIQYMNAAPWHRVELVSPL
jgi:hypothetical protein